MITVPIRRTGRGLLSLAPLFCAAGCAPAVGLAVAPDVLSSEWRSEGPAAATAEGMPPDLGAAFASPALRELIVRAAAANADLGAARARVMRARAELGLARTAMLPVVSGSAGIAATKTDNRGGPVFNFADGFAGLNVAFDTDLFGANRAERRSARARFLAERFDQAALALVVETEVARAFVRHAALTDRIALLESNLAGARELERIVGVQQRAGAATRVDLGLQTIQVRQLETERLRLLEARDRTRNALAILVGMEAPLFTIEPSGLGGLSVPAIPAAPPPALLVRRPDIRAAEARIAAAEGDIDRARAAFLPRLRLTASALGQAASVAGPFGTTLAAGADLLGPIFDRGRLRSGLRIASATQAETVELYRRQLLTALAEAEDALGATVQARAREALLIAVVEEARTTARLSRLQYIEGEADLLRVLDAEQLLVRAEDARAVALQERLEAAVDLFKAMGGSVPSRKDPGAR